MDWRSSPNSHGKKQTMNLQKSTTKRKHDPFFRWLFSDVYHLRNLLELAGKVDIEVSEFLLAINLDTLVRIPDSFSEVDDTGEADLAFRVSVVTGAPVLVGVLLEHKSGRDPGVIEQIAGYVNSVMRVQDKNRIYSGIPTMAIIFYNGRENWNPLKGLEEGYPEYFRGSVLPFRCVFVNMADIPDSDCLACEDVATGMGVVAMKYAYNKEKLLEILPRFRENLRKMPRNEVSCLLQKINIYLKEYVDEDVLKELDMAFVSVGQKYGFVSAGDVFRQRLADARKETEEARNEVVAAQKLADEERQKAEEDKLKTARGLYEDGVSLDTLVRRFNLTEEQIRGK